MKWIAEHATAYPVRVAAVVNAGIALAIGFGANITDEQFALLMTFVGSVLALLTERRVSPTAKLPEYTDPDSVTWGHSSLESDDA